MRLKLLFSLLFCVLMAGTLSAQPKGRPRPQFIDPDQLNPGEGARVLSEFRNARIAGDYAFVFELRHMPRRGRGETYRGTMWGSWLPDNRAVSRIQLAEPEQDDLNLLYIGGENGQVIEQQGDAAPRKLEGDERFQPLVGNITFTPFELQMPFLFWTDYVYEGTKKVRGRPAHYFLLYPPDDFPLKEIGAVRVVIDADFNAMLEAQILGPDEEPLKSFKINSFKKVDEQWIVKSIDLIDERTRDKTRFTVKRARVGVHLPQDIFTPESLNEAISPVPWQDFTAL